MLPLIRGPDGKLTDLTGEVYLGGAKLDEAHLDGATLSYAHLEGAHLWCAHLKCAKLEGAYLESADIIAANLEGADLTAAHLEGASLLEANLEKTNIKGAYIQEADFSRTVVDGRTLVWKCNVDADTKFEGVGLGNIRIYPGTKQLLEYNIRRKNWGEWYKNHRFLKWPVSGFWWLSDYGLSTWQVIKAFLVFAVVFAVLYYSWGAVDHYLLKINDRPGLVSNLFVLESGDPVSWCEVPIRALYFSVVTMTTLGFGDMYANVAIFSDNPYANLRSGWGHFLLMIQVILGYVLLGALILRGA